MFTFAALFKFHICFIAFLTEKSMHMMMVRIKFDFRLNGSTGSLTDVCAPIPT